MQSNQTIRSLTAPSHVQVSFELPGRSERLRMINLYMQRYLLKPIGKAKTVVVTGVEEEHIQAAADQTEGFSGREIAKLAIAWQVRDNKLIEV